MNRVLVVGESIIDIVSESGSTRKYPGGSPANVAVGVAKLGVPVSFLTRIGSDAHGRRILDHLVACGVRVDPASAGSGRTPTAVATIGLDGSAQYSFDLDWRLPDDPMVGHPTVLHVGSIATFLEPGSGQLRDLVRATKQESVITYDPNIRPAIIGSREDELPAFTAMTAMSDVVKLSREDADWLYPGVLGGDVLRQILDLGPKIAILTDGGNGSLILTRRHELSVSAYRTQVVDTIGAGDTFMASVVTAVSDIDISDPTREDLAELGEQASAAAALCVGRAGAQPPTGAEIRRFRERSER